MFFGGIFQDRHQQLLMVGRDVGRFKKGRNLELSGRHFVMPGLGRNAQAV